MVTPPDKYDPLEIGVGAVAVERYEPLEIEVGALPAVTATVEAAATVFVVAMLVPVLEVEVVGMLTVGAVNVGTLTDAAVAAAPLVSNFGT